MILEATREGLAAARANPRLAVAFWLLNLALALAAGVPGWRAIHSAIALLPGADVLADGIRLGVVLDLLEMQPGLLRGLALSAAGVALLGVVVGAAAVGGALEVLLGPADRPFAHRFGGGAGRYFGRFVRAGVTALVVGAVSGGLLAGPLFALARKMRRDSGSEALSLALSLSGPLVLGLVVVIALLALDVARVRIVREDSRRALRLVLSGFWLVLRHPVKWLGTWSLNAFFVAVAFAALVLFGSAVAGTSWPLIALAFGANQVFVLARAGLRVALLGSEIALVEQLRPLPPPPVADEPAANAEAEVAS